MQEKVLSLQNKMTTTAGSGEAREIGKGAAGMGRWVVKLEVKQPAGDAPGLDAPAAAVAQAVSDLRPSVMVADERMVMSVRVDGSTPADAERYVIDLLSDAGASDAASVIDIREEPATRT